MKSRNYLRSILAAMVWLTIAGCQSGAKLLETAAHTEERAQAATRRTVSSDTSFQLEEAMLSQVKTEELQEQPISMLLMTTGKVQFNEDHMARILASVNGQVLQLNIKVGDTVHKGETLFFMKSREVVVAVTEHLESHKDLDLAEKTFAMTKDLFEHQAASRISLQQAESEVAKEQAHVARNEEALRVLGVDVHESDSYGDMSSRIPIKTPLSGTVIERHLTEGQFVQPDSNPLLTIADLSSVWVLADIFERDLHRVQVGQKAEVTTEAYPENQFVARVSYISEVIDPATRTVKVRFLVSNPGPKLKPEMFASLKLFLDESVRGLTVPVKAVFTESGRNFVYVRVNNREFARRQVEIAPDGTARLRVSSGLKVGDKIVSEGAVLLRQQERQQKEG